MTRKRAPIVIDGVAHPCIDRLGYNADVGGYVAMVEVDGQRQMAVKLAGRTWRLWTAADRTEPLRSAIRQGWGRPRKQGEHP